MPLLKQPGGEIIPLTKQVILKWTENNNPSFQDEEKTLMFPIYPNLKYEGPVGIAGIDTNTEKGRNNNIRGQEIEIKVIEAIFNHSKKQKLGLKIFHGVQITEAKMEAFCDIYQNSMPQFDSEIIQSYDKGERKGHPIIQIEIDVLVVSKAGLTLVEVKANEKEGFKAMEQLKKAKHIIQKLSEVVGVHLDEDSIQQVVAVPSLTNTILKSRADKHHVDIFETDNKNETEFLSTIFVQNGPEILAFESLRILMGSLAFLKCSRPMQEQKFQIKVEHSELDESILEGIQGQQIALKLKNQYQIEKWSKEKAKRKSIQEDIYIWLDPNQVEILCEENKQQIIYGPASTGKTILTQLKIIEILKQDSTTKVLVILPYERVVEIYKNFFSSNKVDKSFRFGDLEILTADEDWESFVGEFHPHIFIDEFAAIVAGDKSFEQKLKKVSKLWRDDKFFWITMDTRQCNLLNDAVTVNLGDFDLESRNQVKSWD